MLELLYNHTVGRIRAAWAVATFPTVTQRWYDLRLWRSCGRLALTGLRHRDAFALLPFVNERARVEAVVKRGGTPILPPAPPRTGWWTCTSRHCGWMSPQDRRECPRCNAKTAEVLS
jgi:hypothetical protein